MAAPVPNTQHGMRQRNLSLVMRAIAEHGPLSRAAVAGRIGLTRAAVSTLVEELTRVGLLVELGRSRPGTVGRPGSALGFGESGPAGIGAEIGVDHLAVCAVDLLGRVRVRVEEPAENRDSRPEPVLRRLGELCERVIAEAGREGLRPAGIAVAAPGLVARESTVVVRAPNLGWEAVDVAPGLTLSPLPLTVDNEANLGALAELWLGSHEPALQDFLHVSAEIGIGAAVVVDGALLRGAHGFAGELGHVPVRPEGHPCACGGRGCLEQYAGEEAVLRAAGPSGAGAGQPGDGRTAGRPGGEGRTGDGPGSDGRTAGRPGGDGRMSDEPGGNGRTADGRTGGGPDSGSRTADGPRTAGQAGIDRLLERAAQGDRKVRTALRDAGTALGTALAGVVNLLDPQTVVLGGALAELSPWLLPAAERELSGRVAERGGIVVSRLGRDGPLLGAAHSVVQAVLDDPMAHTPG